MYIKHTLSSACCLVFLLLISSSATSDSNDSAADLDIKKVALFKNGTGYYYSRADLPSGKKSIEIGQIPIPLQGTFWIAYPKSLKVDKLISRIDDVTTTRTVNSFFDLLKANIGKSISFRATGPDTSLIRGQIVRLLYSESTTDSQSPYFMGQLPTDPQNSRLYQYPYRYQPPPSNPMAEIKTADNRTLIISANSITRVELDEGELNQTLPQKSRRPTIYLELREEAKKEALTVSYLARGMSWSPSYIIDISGPDKALFTAKALIVNELTDLVNVDLSLVTGFPNIKFADIHSPIALTRTLSALMSSMSSDFFAAGVESDLLGQLAVRGGRSSDQSYSPQMPAYSAAESGAVAEDLFLYPVGKISLRANETAYLPLFSEELPYKHVYTWYIPDILDEYERYNSAEQDEDEAYGEIVWHIARIENNTGFPLTTASAEFVKDGIFVGQDVCYYTAPGEKADIKINRAMNIIAERNEYEVERQRNAGEFYGWHFDLVTVEGELKIRNRTDKAITLEITKTLSGEVLSIEPSAEHEKIAKGLQRVNPRHNLVWTIELDAGESKTISYKYEVYVRI